MRKKIIKVLVILTVMCLIIMGLSCKSFGDYVSNLRDQQANLQSQLEASNIQVEIIQSDISELAAQILQMNEDITSQEIEVDLLRSQSKELQESIEKNEVELEEITETYNKQKKILEARLVASYKSGEIQYLDYLLQASSLPEFISTYYYISEMVEADSELLVKTNKQKEELELAKLELKKQKKQLAQTLEESENKAVSLANKQTIKDAYIRQLSEEEQKYTTDIIEMQTEIKKVEAEILEAAALHIGFDYVGGEMAWPVPGYTRITSEFGMRTHPITGVYKLHTGTDIGAPLGTPFIAANDGVVVKAGWNNAYGNMVMINHGGGVSTLYAHGSEILVQVGQEVKRGEEVLKVGSTGYSTGPHAHFEVRINGITVNPLPYITNGLVPGTEENINENTNSIE